MRTALIAVLVSLIFSACSDQEKGQQPSESIESTDKPVFSLLSQKHTGVGFNNLITDTDEMNRIIYEYFYNGGGVAAGDINNDGLVDLYFTGNMVDDKLYLNKGNLQFEDITSKSGIETLSGWRTGVNMVDINHDGFQDIYICRSGWFENADQRRNLLYINNGDLTFTEQAAQFGLDDPGNSVQAAFFDYDLDNDLDMYLSTHMTSKTSYSNQIERDKMISEGTLKGDRFYINEDGKYRDITENAGIASYGFGHGVSIGDINGDRYPDLFVARDFMESDYIYINNGDGTFTESIKEMTNRSSYFSMGSDIADFNNDGLMDLMVLDMTAADHFRSKTNMASMDVKQFSKMLQLGYHHQYMINTLQYNHGNGFFSEIAQLSGVAKTDWSWSTLFADLDNDGLKDLFITNGIKRDILNNDIIHEGKQQMQTLGRVLTDMEILKIAPMNRLSNYVFHNSGGLLFKPKMKEWGIDDEVNSNGAAYADLDNDGDLELIINNVDTRAYIYKNLTTENGNGNYISLSLEGPGNNSAAIGSRIEIETENGTQVNEIFSTRGYLSSVPAQAHFGLGKVVKTVDIRIIWPDKTVTQLDAEPPGKHLHISYKQAIKNPWTDNVTQSSLFTESLDANGMGFIHRETIYNDFQQEILLPHKYSQNGPFISHADINNDGLEDIYIGGAAGQSGKIYIQKNNNRFQELANPQIENDRSFEDLNSLFFDADSDGDMDLYVTSGSNEYPLNSSYYFDRLYINDGCGVFSRSYDGLPEHTISSQTVKAADIDNDGDLDLFVGGRIVPGQYPFPTNSHLLINEGGKFSENTHVLCPELLNAGMVTDALFSDYDGDHDADLIITGEWMPIRVFENENGHFHEKRDIGFENTEGWWYTAQEIDLDNDGDMDYVFGNLGKNAKFKASEDIPFHVYSHDFDGNGNIDIVLSNQVDNRLLPVRGRECTSEQMPFIQDKYPTYEEFALADLGDMYGTEQLGTSLHYEAYTFKSQYAINDGKGNFVLHELPIEAQFSQIQAIAVYDFTGDGWMDLLIGGNQFETEVETPRYDASTGLLLKNSGDGTFTSIPVAESGFFIPGNVKDIELVKTENQTLIIVGNNNDEIQVFTFNGNKKNL